MRPSSSLSGARRFALVMRRGRRAASDGVTAYCLPNELGRVRLGLAVGRSVGTAVERNKVKRRLREAFKGYRPQSGVDVVISAGSEVRELGYAALRAHLGEALRATGVRVSER